MEASFIDAEKLKRRDEELKINVRQVCKDLNMPRSVYYDVINGRSGATESNLEKISKALQMPMREFIRVETVNA